MSEHSNNLTALIAKTLPTFPPAERDGHAEIRMRVAWKRNILVLPAADMRTVDGERQFRRTADGAWEKFPEGIEGHALGEPLPPEKCDVVFALLGVWVDMMEARQGKQRAGVQALPGELLRLDLCDFLKHAEASLPAERRIIAPGLGVVP